MFTYPPMRLAVLRGFKDLKADLSVLDAPDCPYDAETVGLLKDLLAPTVVEKVVERNVEKIKNGRGRPSKDVQLSEEDQDYILKETKQLIEELKMLSTKGLEPNEVNALAKTKTQLIDKLLTMAERAYNLKRMSEFQTTVMGILEDLVDEKGRETFLSRLEPYR